jgi:dTDP-4-amino-4,6-dideoxygalactose transaminase
MSRNNSKFNTQNSKLTKRIFLSPPHMSGEEMRFVQEAFDSNYIAPVGPMVDAFEQEFSEYVGIKHCLALSSGTAAMHLALRILGVGQGDEVIASTLTFIGSVTPVVFQGASLVFVDCDRQTWNMDPGLLEEELAACERRGKMPKAVIPTDLYGQCCDLPRIVEICDGYGVPVVCDSAESLGAKYLTQRRKDAKGEQEKDNALLGDLGGFARESFLHAGKGAKAAVGRGQLRVLDERVKKRREIFDYYQEALGDLPGIEFMPEPEWSRSNRWLTVILIKAEEFGADPSTIFRTYGAGREKVRLALDKENIEARPVWKPMHLQPVFRVVAQSRKLKAQSKAQKTYEVKVVGGEVAEDLFDRGLCLPSGTAMTEGDLERVVEVIRNCRKKAQKAQEYKRKK